MATKPVKRSPADRRQSASKSDHWFHSKTPAAQKAYILAHPNSIYAKKAALHAKRNPAKLSPELRQTIREKWATRDRENAKAYAEIQDRRYAPKAHEKRMKEHEKSHALYSKKADAAARKVAEHEERVAKHTASGSRHLQTAKNNLARAKHKHNGLKRMVENAAQARTSEKSMYDKHHGKSKKKRATKRPSVEP